MGRLTAEFSAAFLRDLKKKAHRRNWNLVDLQSLIDLVLENSPESMEILKRRHNMHRLSGSWQAEANVMLQTRATGLLSGRQMTTSPSSSALVATTNCLDESVAVSF